MRRDAGFTLVELLIALALTGLVTLLILGGTRFAALGLNHTAAASERLETQRNLAELLRRTLASAVVVPVLPGEPPLVGAPDRVAFLSLAEDGGAGLYRVAIAVEAAGPARALVLRRRRAGAPEAAAERTVLLAPLGGFALAYFGRAEGDGAARWHARWERLPGLPTLVRITLDGQDMPLVVRLWGAG